MKLHCVSFMPFCIMKNVNSGKVHTIALLSLVSLIIVISALFLLRDIYDPDFFWHIKTGEWIWQHKSLPSTDPFAYTSAGHQTSREHFILTSFWLSQVTYHLLYLASGLPGIVFLRFLIAGILLFVFWKRNHGDNIVYLSLIMIFLTFFLKLYPVERPQVFSFLFFAMLLSMLERIRETDFKESAGWQAGKLTSLCRAVPIYFSVPLLMMVWANMHPGFIVGQATLIFYVVMEGVKYLQPSFRPMEKQAYKKLCLTATAGIVISFANPNIYHVWQEYLQYKTPSEHWNLSAAYISSLNPDYMSSLQFFVWSNDYAEILYWFIIVLAVAALAINWRRTDITDLAFLAVLGFISFAAVRYSFFFMAAALPVISRSFSREGLLRFSRIAIPPIALFSSLFFSWGERNNFEALGSGVKINNYLCPVKAADFIIANNIRGNMYNVYEWGGYLIWRLAPERQVFGDPRDIFEETARESTLMDNANADEASGNPAWKAIAQKHGMEYMVIHIAQMTGRVIPLFFALMQDRDWLPVFADINAVIFVRNSPVNEHVINKYSIPKDYLMNALVTLYERLTDENPADVNLYITKGDLYMSQARVAKAAEAFEKAIGVAPFNAIAREKLNLLRGRTG